MAVKRKLGRRRLADCSSRGCEKRACVLERKHVADGSEGIFYAAAIVAIDFLRTFEAGLLMYTKTYPKDRETH
jgi:hypothetical protein